MQPWFLFFLRIVRCTPKSRVYISIPFSITPTSTHDCFVIPFCRGGGNTSKLTNGIFMSSTTPTTFSNFQVSSRIHFPKFRSWWEKNANTPTRANGVECGGNRGGFPASSGRPFTLRSKSSQGMWEM